MQYFPELKPVLVNSDAGSPDGTQRVVIETEPPDYVESILLVRPTNRLDRVTLTYPEIDGVGGKGAALRTIFEIAAALESRRWSSWTATCARSSPSGSSCWPGPILKGGYDFVAPLYARYKYDGTITNTVTYPLTARSTGTGSGSRSAARLRRLRATSCGTTSSWTTGPRTSASSASTSG